MGSASKKRQKRFSCYKDFRSHISAISFHPEVRRMKLFPHHGKTDCYRHCLHVALCSYRWCRRLKLDYRSAARAGMLHDMFLYDWHTRFLTTGERLHGLRHPKLALENAGKYFPLNSTEEDIILNHMWPLTFFRFPRTKEGWIIVLADKYCGLLETLRLL